MIIDCNKIPIKSVEDSRLNKTIQETQQQKIGNNMSLLRVVRTTEAAKFTKSKPFDFVMFGLRQPDLLHKVDEYAKLNNYLDRLIRISWSLENIYKY